MSLFGDSMPDMDWNHHRLSVPAYFAYWGKARLDAPGSFHLLPYHCLDVAAVGREYLLQAEPLRKFLMKELHLGNDEALLDWFSFWLALHDLGKFSEAFQSQRPDLFALLRGREPRPEKYYSERHDSLGMKFWQDDLSRKAADEAWFGVHTASHDDALACWARAVTGHHGQPPKEVSSIDRFFDLKHDGAAIHAFVSDVRALMIKDGAGKLLEIHGVDAFWKLSMELSWWVAGIAVLSDWIGSNAEIFTYRHQPTTSLAEYWPEAQRLAQGALRISGVLPAHRQAQLRFDELFPSITQPSPLQAWAASVNLDDGPQLHILEDVTGAGKTEAALTVAHRLTAQGCGDGFFIGLPTMATANAMYERVAHVCAKLFAGDFSLVLAHGRKELVESFAVSVLKPGREESDPRQQDETATARCTAWLADHNKRALLAPAGVGTIDQALMAALQSRHQSLRLLGLFHKVLIVDEVHACDAYMQGVLEALLQLHARAGGSAVLLSATLPQRMKRSLLKAFSCGCQAAIPALDCNAYPLTTSWSACQPSIVTERPTDTRRDVQRRVAIRYESDRMHVIAGIVDALNAGQCVAWIRNTVGDAIDARNELALHVTPDRITLFHARFALGDRLAIENKVLEAFGRDSGPEQRTGKLLIATQVAEQSLDVDFDLVVSDLAPIDRLIQRAGRLRRHVRDAAGSRLRVPHMQDQRGEPCLWVFGPEWTEGPAASWFKQFLPKAASVYPHHAQLWLTARALRRGQIDMPSDARRLIESVFGDESEAPEGLRGNANKAEGKDYGEATLARQNSIKLNQGYERLGNEWMSDATAPSRLGEETIEVLLARWADNRLEPWFPHPIERHAWAYSSVRVAKRLIADTELPQSPTRQAALAAVKERLPGGGKWSLVLPFDEIDGRHLANATGRSKGGKPSPSRWLYDACEGLRQITTSNTEEA